MIRWKAKFTDRGEELAKQFRYRTYRALERFGFLVRGTAKQSIEHTDGASPAGTPPHTHRGLLPKSILYGLAKDDPAGPSVVIGPSQNVVGTVGAAFEHEGSAEFRGQDYPERSFMGPAMSEDRGQLPGLIQDEYGKVN